MSEQLNIEKPLFGIIIMVGTNSADKKKHRTGLFLDDSDSFANNYGNHTSFTAQAYFTTRSLGSVGWNYQIIKNNVSLDFPIIYYQQYKTRVDVVVALIQIAQQMIRLPLQNELVLKIH